MAMDLVRLGFRKVFLVDRDVVDAHNLNRQMLFSKDDVGRSKVEAAKESLQRHNIHTEIVALHMDGVICCCVLLSLGAQAVFFLVAN